jgi:hypothetical protein
MRLRLQVEVEDEDEGPLRRRARELGYQAVRDAASHLLHVKIREDEVTRLALATEPAGEVAL